VVKNCTDLIEQQKIASIVFDKAQPNSTVSNVNDGLEILRQSDCDNDQQMLSEGFG